MSHNFIKVKTHLKSQKFTMANRDIRALFSLLSKWENRLINPNWIENFKTGIFIVTEMIYEDLMANSYIRAVSPKDLN